MNNKEIDYPYFKLNEVQGRYVTNEHIIGFLQQLDPSFHLQKIGSSVQNKPIYELTIGTGEYKILMWSQMHGNESTTTKAVLDVLNFFHLEKEKSKDILASCTFKIIPILNPDGAEAYTRVNANHIDLNRDAQDLSQPESRVLKNVFLAFAPDYCFNLHDQRTIFNVGDTNKPATVSFLAPAFDVERNNSNSRELSMLLIAAMNAKLQHAIKGQVGRYDDSFNANCVGDAFQMTNTPTILFEAGHYPMDYQREKTREFIYQALMTGIYTIIKASAHSFTVDDYLSIPENNKLFFDIVLHHAHVLDPNLEINTSIGILYKETLVNSKIVFKPIIEKRGLAPNQYFGHKIIDCHVASDVLWLKQNGILAII